MDISSLIDISLNNMKARDPDLWRWGPGKQAAYWNVHYTGYQPPCRFYIEAGQNFIYLHAPLEIRVWPECRLALYRYVLRQNEEMSGAKFSLLADCQLALNVEWPRENLTPVALETAIQILITYFELYYADIQSVAQDVDLARYIESKEVNDQAKDDIQINVLPA
jgi:hypothetical protein